MLFLGDEDVHLANDLLCQRYTQSRYIPPEDDWPPYHPKHYTPLTIFHHQERRYENEVITGAPGSTVIENGEMCGKSIKSINDFFTPFERTSPVPFSILIEGAPGIGKTILSKEIALQWANRTVLHNTKLLFLLFMRDPQVKSITSILSLVKYFYENNELSNKITDWLVKTNGNYLTIILDGYDEVSEGNKNLFINDIIKRKKLTKCGVVITSRPAASSHLHSIVDCRAEVLGFTDDDRQNFIQNALQDQNSKIDDLKGFLQSNPFLNNLCYIPLNMSILLCLSKDTISALPKTQTKLYEKFIIMTIVHFLKKDKKVSDCTIASFNDLPVPYDHVVKELSEFAFLALLKNQLVFTLADAKKICPNLTPSNWYGLGLLQCVRYFKPQDACDYESFHFLHFAIQEYMAAYHIASLPDHVQLKLLNGTFWKADFFNTWVMYVGITGGCSFVFKHFLSGNYFQISSWLFGTPRISSKILGDKIKCLHLLHCLGDADHEMLPSIKSTFRGRTIDLSNQSLTPKDVQTLSVLLLRSRNEHWEMINLSHCNIDSKCCNVLCEMFLSKNSSLKVKSVNLSYNNFDCESLHKLSGTFKSWNTTELVLSIDSLYDGVTMKKIIAFTEKLKSAFVANVPWPGLPDNSYLLVNYIAEQNKMIAVCASKSYIMCSHFTGCKLSDTAIESLKDFTMKLKAPAVTHVIFSVHVSNTFATKQLSALPASIQSIRFCGSYLHSKGVYLLTTASTIHYHNVPLPQQVADYLAGVVYHNTQSKTSYLLTLPSCFAEMIRYSLCTFTTLETFSVMNNYLSSEAADDIAAILTHATELQQLYLSGNNLQAIGAIKIARAIQNVTTLTKLNVSNNNITHEAANDIAMILSHSTKLQLLFLDSNNLQASGAITISRALRNTTTLVVLNLANNNISDEAADDIAAVLSCNPKLQVLSLGENNLQTAGAIKIARGLESTTTLKVFGIINNNISDEGADAIASILSRNSGMEVLELGRNNLQSTGVIKIAIALKHITSLTLLSIASNNVGDNAVDDIAAVLLNNPMLETLDLRENNFQSTSAVKIAKALKNTAKLQI